MVRVNNSQVLVSAILIGGYVIFLLILRSLFPKGEDLVDFLGSIYGRFGYEIITIGATFEALILINFFTPGILAIALGAIFAKAGELDLTLAIVAAVLGTLIGYTLDFMLGRFGFANLLSKMGYEEVVEETKAKVERFDLKTLSLGFIHPNIGAIISVAAGALNLKFKNFLALALPSTLIWYIFWGLLIFTLGKIFLTVFTRYSFILLLLVGSIWILIILFGSKRRS